MINSNSVKWLIAALFVGVFLLSGAGAEVLAGQEPPDDCRLISLDDLIGRESPRFESFPAASTPGLRPAAVNWNSHPLARRFRTAIRNAVAAGPNFAGHFTLIGWGCGSSCLEWALVDARTGRVHFPPREIATVSTVHVETASEESRVPFNGLRFRPDSRLLILLGAPAEDDSREGILFYHWSGKTFKKVRAYRIQRPWSACLEDEAATPKIPQ